MKSGLMPASHVQLQVVLTSCRASAWQPAMRSCTRSNSRLFACRSQVQVLLAGAHSGVCLRSEGDAGGGEEHFHRPASQRGICLRGGHGSRQVELPCISGLRPCLEERQLLALHFHLRKLETAELSLHTSNAACRTLQ